MIVLDSDVVIEILEKDSPKGEEALRRLESSGDDISITAISAHELLYGLGKRSKTTDGVRALTTLAYEPLDAEVSAGLELKLERRGEPVGRTNCMIAAMAMTRGARLFTFNEKHFGKMARYGLTLF